MASISNDVSLLDFQKFIEDVYKIPNDRQFNTTEMLTNIQRFTMRGIKGIRKKDPEKTKKNLLIAFSWFVSLMNQLHINLEKDLWERFPGVCPYCRKKPCQCKEIKPEKRIDLTLSLKNKKPETLEEFQELLEKIYPFSKRTIEDAGIHLAEEMGELSEAILIYRSQRQNKDFEEIKLESADYTSCLLGIFNSLKINLAEELSKTFSNNCHACHKMPCKCDFNFLTNFKF